MPRRRFLRLALLAALSLGLSPLPAAASDREDQERARAALAAGEIRPLAEILAEVERRYLGRVIEVELDHEDGRWIYDLKLLPPDGRVFELEVDARTAETRRSKGPVQERR
jgi:uncharacterized membrane protein YkoI